jgi:hypothetical protein
MQALLQAPRHVRWRRRAAVAGLLVALVAGGLCACVWYASRTFLERVESEVRAGVPIGATREEALSWVGRTYGVVPWETDDVTGDQFQGQTVPELAGVPADEVGRLIRVVVRRRGLFAEPADAVHYAQVFEYLLIDRNGRVSGYFFLSPDQLREMEAAKRAVP